MSSILGGKQTFVLGCAAINIVGLKSARTMLSKQV